MEKSKLPLNMGLVLAVSSLVVHGSTAGKVLAENPLTAPAPDEHELSSFDDNLARLARLAFTTTLQSVSSSYTAFEKHSVVHHHYHHNQATYSNSMPSLLRRIGGCESDGSPTAPINYTAQNPDSTASGGFQFLDTTWNRFHGFLRAKDAPPAIQDSYAERTFAEDGTSPWISSESCWE